MTDELKYWLWLSLVFGSANERMWKLMSICESASEAHCVLCRGNEPVELTPKERKCISTVTLDHVNSIIENCNEYGIRIASYDSPEYPKVLRYITEAPPVLYYQGDILCVTGTKTVTSVGTRSADEYGIKMAKRICGELAAEGYVIVSGFALGVDIASHMAAAAQGMPTACVLGCGIDVDYPKENKIFRQTIIDAGGVFISEFPPGTQSFPGNFPKRNRILSALGHCAIVFQAAGKSGSMVTARIAADQGRDVFVLPPPDIYNAAYAGNIKLLRAGAVPIFGVEEIRDLFAHNAGKEAADRHDAFMILDLKKLRDHENLMKREQSVASMLTNNKTGSKKAAPVIPDTPVKKAAAPKTKKRKKKKEPEPEIEVMPVRDVLEDITDERQRAITLLLRKEGALHADAISDELDIDAADLMTELTELELLGAVRALPGRMYESAN